MTDVLLLYQVLDFVLLTAQIQNDIVEIAGVASCTIHPVTHYIKCTPGSMIPISAIQVFFLPVGHYR